MTVNYVIVVSVLKSATLEENAFNIIAKMFTHLSLTCSKSRIWGKLEMKLCSWRKGNSRWTSFSESFLFRSYKKYWSHQNHFNSFSECNRRSLHMKRKHSQHLVACAWTMLGASVLCSVCHWIYWKTNASILQLCVVQTEPYPSIRQTLWYSHLCPLKSTHSLLCVCVLNARFEAPQKTIYLFDKSMPKHTDINRMLSKL